MKKTKARQILLLAAVILFAQSSCFADPIGGFNPSDIPTNMNYGGIINSHDMMMLKEKQRLQDEAKDFQNFQDRKQGKHKKDEVIKDETGSGEKIYDAETSQKLKEQQELLKKEQQKKKKRFGFFKRKSKNNQEEQIQEQSTGNAAEDSATQDDSKKKIIEKTDTTTTIKAKTEKTNVQDGKVFIKAVGVTNSQILSDAEIQAITDSVIGQYVSFEDLEKLVQDFNYAYAEKGYVTARAFLPPQTIQDGVVRINLVEGLVGEVSVENAKWTSENYVKKRISAKKGDIFQIVELEQDILKFNKYNNGIKLKANLVKGEKIGTTDIKLQADEKFPFRVTALMDNAGRKTIGELRGGLMAQADSLFKQRDRLTIGSYASRHSVTPFADYNIPVNKYDGRVGFLFSSSYAQIGEGPYKIFDIESRSYNYSLYYTHPLIRKPNFELNGYVGANYKQAATSFGGYTLNTDKIASVEAALNARLDTKKGIWYLNQGVYQAFPLFDKDIKYFKYTGSLIRLHDFGHGIVGQLRGMYQFSPEDVMPYIDQFQAGGLATVRGYSEGLLIGRSGYIISSELLFPIAPQKITIKRKNEKRQIPFIGSYVKALAFVDHAGVYPFKGEGPGARSYTQADYMLSMGLGLRISLPGDATARLYWGCPLMHNPNEVYYRNPRFSFEISLSPDIDKILKYRKTLRNKETL